MKIGEAAYRQAQEEAAAAAEGDMPEADAADASAGSDDDIVDADFR